MDNIRNFIIMAHVDHGKSTLADRLLEITETVEKRKMQEQYLDAMELERERGITIKMAPVRMIYKINHSEIPNNKLQITNKSQVSNDQKSKHLEFGNLDLDIADSKQEFVLNLIDTPGHSDFSYEVSRAMAAVEGAVLLVDAMQGIQAQTLANFRIAKELGLVIIPAISKIDLSKDTDELKEEIAELVGCGIDDIHGVSGKTGEGVKELLDAVVLKIPPPESSSPLGASDGEGEIESPDNRRESAARALIFDSLYDPHKGIIAYVRVMDGEMQKGEPLWLCAVGEKADAFETGYFAPELTQSPSLGEGSIGYIALGIKDPSLVRIGDTITHVRAKDKVAPLPGYKEPLPVVFASFYPQNADDFDELFNAIEKLHLTDASFTFEPEASDALGRGFRLGFLGTLHLEIIAERIKREFGVEVITTAPSVAYRIHLKSGEEMTAFKPQDFPDEGSVARVAEPMIIIDIIARAEDYGAILQLSGEYRMRYEEVEYFGKSVRVGFIMPLSELLGDFYDKLKSVTSGYASVNYHIAGYEDADVAKTDILLAGQEIPEFSRVIPAAKLDRDARKFVAHLKEVLPRENFPVAIQAKARGRIVARENLPALKKDVTGHLYGGDRSRKMKLWKKQKKGKKKLLALARVNIPHDVYIKILRGDK